MLMRHAKSSWKHSEELDDIERPLKKRGRRDASRIGRALLDRGLLRDVCVFRSHACRTEETWQRVRAAAAASSDNTNIAKEESVVESLYAASHNIGTAQANIGTAQAIIDAMHEDVQRAFSRDDESHQAVMILGHNPGIESLVRLLVDDASSKLVDMTMTTGNVAILVQNQKVNAYTPSSWATPRSYTLESILRPRELAQTDGDGDAM